MITVAGFNTAIDRRVELAKLQPGAVQRATSASVSLGGKGLHVAQTIATLGESVRLVGLVDPAHANQLSEYLHARRVEWHPVHTRHPLRQCLALREADGQITEVLEPGTELDATLQHGLLDEVRDLLDTTQVLVLSGSLPCGFPSDTYANLVREAARRDVPCLVDASGTTLEHAVQAGPWLVKPNRDEATALVNHPIDTLSAAANCLRELYSQGVTHPIVTLGALGAVGLDGRTTWHAWTPSAGARNAVGSGDCFLAGMAVGAVRSAPLEQSLHLAIACGAANAESNETGQADLARVQHWLSQGHVEPWAGGSPGDPT